MAERVKGSLMGCRIFYFSLNALFFIAVLLYKTDLSENLIYSFFIYLPLSIVAAVLFVKAGTNPGFVETNNDA